jgi:hypothetical protein
MSIAVAGNISKEAEAKIQSTFGKWKMPKKEIARSFDAFVPRAPKKGEWLAFYSKKTEQTQLGLSFHGSASKAADLPAIKLLAHILGGSMSSRLFVEVREKRGLCYFVGSGHISFEDTGAFTITSGLDPKRVEEAVHVIWRELQKIVEEGVTAAELRHAKDHIRGKMMLYFEDTSNQASWYLRQWQTFGAPREPEVALADLEAVTQAQIKAAGLLSGGDCRRVRHRELALAVVLDLAVSRVDRRALGQVVEVAQREQLGVAHAGQCLGRRVGLGVGVTRRNLALPNWHDKADGGKALLAIQVLGLAQIQLQLGCTEVVRRTKHGHGELLLQRAGGAVVAQPQVQAALLEAKAEALHLLAA